MKSNATDNDTDTVLVRRRRVVVQKKKRGMRAYSESETDVLADLGLTCSPSKARWVLLAVVVLLACAVYSNVTSCGFVFDDEAAVIKNPDVNPAAPLADLLRHDFWGQNIKSKDSHKSFRPFTTLTFKLNRLLFDRTGGPARGPVVGLSGDHIEDGYTQTPSALAPSFHAVNAALHVAACLLVYFVAAEVFRASEAEAFVSTVLFAVHPVHTEAVTGVVGRADLLSAVFGMASYIAFSRAARKCATSYSLLALSMVFTVLAAASKENGMTVPCVLLVHDLVAASGVFPSLYQVFKRSTWTRGSPSRSCETTDKVEAKDGKEEMCHEIIEKITLEDDARAHLRSLTRPQVRAFLVRQAVNLSVLVALLAFRKSVTATMASESHFRYIESPLLLAHGPSYLYSMGRVHTKYMELLVAPIHLSADWSFNQLPLVYNLFCFQNLVTLASYSCLLYAVVSAAWDLERGKYHLVSLAWLVATFIPAANIFYVVGTMIGERLLYVPSVGFCLFVGRVFTRAFAKSDYEGRTVLSVFFALILVWCSAKTHNRNYDWKDQETLFRVTTVTSPDSAKAQLMYGEFLLAHGKVQDAMKYIARAKEISPDFCDLDNPIGASLYAIGRVEESLTYMHRALRCIPTRKVAAINLNKIYNERIAKNPGDIGAYAGWADVLSNINRTEEAAEYYITSAELASRAGKKALTKSMYGMAVQVCPSNCEANFLYGTALLADGKLSEATAYFLASSHAHNCSTTFVYSIGRLNYIYQMATEDAEKGAELQVGLDRLTAIAKRITSALEDPVFLEAKEKVMEQQDQKEKEEKKKEDEEDEKNEKGSTKSRFDVSTLGTSDEGYILIEYDDDDDENTV